MKKQFCTYEISLKLKELGFDEKCMATYMLHACGDVNPFEYNLDYATKVQLHHGLCSKNSDYINDWIAAPLWQQVIDWFRDVHNLEINVFKSIIKCYHDNELALPHYCFDIEDAFQYSDDYIYQSIDHDLKYHTYQEAREAAILKATELKQKIK
jgi:hypothetical protein